jgi:hypothetical protein
MGYKLLGFMVWRGGKWYVRRRFHGTGRKLAVTAIAGLLLAGAGAAAVQRSHESQ